MKEDELKLCPFCKFEADTHQDFNYGHQWTCYCMKCGAVGERCATEEEAIKTWNIRTEPLQELGEQALKDFLYSIRAEGQSWDDGVRKRLGWEDISKFIYAKLGTRRLSKEEILAILPSQSVTPLNMEGYAESIEKAQRGEG